VVFPRNLPVHVPRIESAQEWLLVIYNYGLGTRQFFVVIRWLFVLVRLQIGHVFVFG